MTFDKRFLGGVCLLLAATVLIVVKFSSNDGATDATSPPLPPAAHPAGQNQARTKTLVPVPAPALQTDGPPGVEPVPSDEKVEIAREAAIEKIEEASTTYDPAQLPVIRPYLVSPDPELRAAAVDAMIVLGDASAGAMLREAAKSMSSVEEAKKMEEAADYVELPPVNIKRLAEKLKKRREAKDAATVPPEKTPSNEPGTETPAR